MSVATKAENGVQEADIRYVIWNFLIALEISQRAAVTVPIMTSERVNPVLCCLNNIKEILHYI
jgi:hypothetical protein